MLYRKQCRAVFGQIIIIEKDNNKINITKFLKSFYGDNNDQSSNLKYIDETFDKYFLSDLDVGDNYSILSTFKNKWQFKKYLFNLDLEIDKLKSVWYVLKYSESDNFSTSSISDKLSNIDDLKNKINVVSKLNLIMSDKLIIKNNSYYVNQEIFKTILNELKQRDVIDLKTFNKLNKID